MSYFLIPKTYDYKIQYTNYDGEQETSFSPSLNSQFKFIFNQLNDIIDNLPYNIRKESIIDTYYYLYNSFEDNNCVAKQRYTTNTYFEFIELISFLNLNNQCSDENLNVYINSDNNNYIQDAIIHHRSQKNIILQDRFHISHDFEERFNLIIFSYTLNFQVDTHFILSESIKLIINSLTNNGCLILKIPHLNSLLTNQFIYLLTYLFDKTYLIKPLTSNAISNEKYIICKSYMPNRKIDGLFKNGWTLKSIINTQLPIYFINKLRDVNIIIGQKNIDTINVVLNLLLNKVDIDKLHLYQKNNLMKCISWCEKFKIPANKFSQQINIFLSKNNKVSESLS